MNGHQIGTCHFQTGLCWMCPKGPLSMVLPCRAQIRPFNLDGKPSLKGLLWSLLKPKMGIYNGCYWLPPYLNMHISQIHFELCVALDLDHGANVCFDGFSRSSPSVCLTFSLRPRGRRAANKTEGKQIGNGFPCGIQST